MVGEHPQWGANISRYITTVDRRLADAFDRYNANTETTIEATHDLIPLPLLETALAIGENMHKIRFQRGDQLFPRLVSNVKGYVRLHRGGIFDNYYGFLCIRHLIRMACISTLTSAGEFDDFMKDLDPDMTPHQVSCRLAEDTLEIMADALRTENSEVVGDLFGSSYSSTGNAFMTGGGFSYEDVEFLVEVLWRGRKGIIELRQAGLLPGLPAMCFVLCEMTALSNKPKQKPWVRLHELVLRCYLGDTTNPERILLRQLSIYIHWKVEDLLLALDYLPIDEADARTVIQAYIDILSPPHPFELGSVLLNDVAMSLFEYVFFLMTNKQKAGTMLLEELAPGVVRSALAKIGLALDLEQDGMMSLLRRDSIRYYTANIFGHMGLMEARIASPTVRRAFSQMLFDNDIHGLAGRVLLLITREPDHTPEHWESLLHGFRRLGQVIQSPPPFSPAELSIIALEWRKVFVHLMYLMQGSVPTTANEDCLDFGMQAWDLTRPASVRRPPDFYECAYPRCATRVAYGRVPEARIICERCREAEYCSPRCQRMHWMLRTVDSHTHDCRPVRLLQ